MKTWREIAELTGFSGEALQELEETEKQARGNLSKDGNLQQILKNRPLLLGGCKKRFEELAADR